jgi:serine/threonine protein kinase
LILMEYCGGGTLADMVRERQLSLDEILKTFSHICGGVAACHSAKPPVIHRDIRVCVALRWVGCYCSVCSQAKHSALQHTPHI